jgi:hypothetical protein
MMENKKISYKKYIGLAAVIFVALLVTSNFDAAFSQNNTDEVQNLNLTGSDPLSTSNATGSTDGSNWTDSNSTYTP